MAASERKYVYQTTAVSSRMVEPHQVRKFQAAVAPEEDETLFGFFYRTLALTAVRRPLVGAALAGIDTSGKSLMQCLLDNPAQIDQLATLLDVDPNEIVARLNTGAELGGGKAALSALGTPVRVSLFLSKRYRRVSPAALRISPHFRQAWEISPLTFDPQTFEMLLDHCPECGSALGWLNAQGVHMCDRCRDGRGLPCVDLRDYPQPTVDEEHRESLGFVASLLDPIPVRAAGPGRLLAERWRGLAPGDIFDAIVDIACCLVAARTDFRLANGPQVVAKITPPILARAGSTFLEQDGFDRLAEFFKLGEDERPNDRGMIKRYGPLHNLANPRAQAHPDIRRAVEDAIHSSGKYRRNSEHSRYAGWLNLNQVSSKFGIPYPRVRAFARSGVVEVVKLTHLRTDTYLVREADVTKLAETAKDAVSLRQVGIDFGLYEDSIRLLQNAGFFQALEEPATSLLCGGPHYAGAQISELKKWLEDLEVHGGEQGLVSIRSLLPRSKNNPLQWGAAFLSLARGWLPVRRPEQGSCDWPDLLVTEAEFSKAQSDALGTIVGCMQDNTIVASNVAAELLGMSPMAIYNLFRSGHLQRSGNGTVAFQVSHLKEFIRRYVPISEVTAGLRFRPSQTRPYCTARGVATQHEYSGSPGAIYLRSDIEAILDVQAGQILGTNGRLLVQCAA